MRAKKPVRYSTLWRWGNESKLWQYKAPLIVVGAGTLGLLLLCGVSAIALRGPQQTLQEEVDPVSVIYSEPDHPVVAAVCKEVGYQAGNIWVSWLRINVPSLLDGHVCGMRSTRTRGSDFDRQGIISREENK
jgi:hypothetical protein